MGEKREAMPGAMKYPAGAKDRERIDSLEQRVAVLEKKLAAIEGKKKAEK